jgi:glycosyltransferase involved in cell wall biosynthesis
MPVGAMFPPVGHSAISESQQSLRVLFLARELGYGGAERQLTQLALGLARRGHDVHVATFYPGEAFDTHFRSSGGARLTVIGKSGRWDVAPFVARLWRFAASLRPHVIYGFLPVPNLLASSLGATVCRNSAIVWGLRGSELELQRYDYLSRAVIGLERALSSLPDLAIANSERVRLFAERRGFPKRKLTVVHNGFDVDWFRPPSAGEKRAACLSLRLPPTAKAVAVVARFDPMKDHETFIRAFSRVASDHHDLYAVFAGTGESNFVAKLRAEAQALGLRDRIIWAGAVQDIRTVYHAADCLCLPSAYGEGFPNVVGEAMSCGTPCIVTDVGNSAEVVGDNGLVIPPRDVNRLETALRLLMGSDSGLSGLIAKARARIIRHYSLESMIAETEGLLYRATSHRHPADGR